MRTLLLLIVIAVAASQAAVPGPTPLPGPDVTAVGCFITSDFTAGGRRNFELLAQEGSKLVHYWRANDSVETPWRKGEVISTHATGAGCIVQSDFLSNGHGNLEVVVPEEGGELVHYWHDSGQPNSDWQRTAAIAHGVTGGVCILTSDYLTNGHRDFEVMALRGDQLWHYRHKAGAPFANWPGERVATGVSALGPGCLVQSDSTAKAHGDFEVVAQKGSDLWHYRHASGMAEGEWPGEKIVSGIRAPGCLIESDHAANRKMRLKLLVAKGETLWQYATPDGGRLHGWQGVQIANGVTGAGCLLPSERNTDEHAHDEVVVPERVQEAGMGTRNELVHYVRESEANPSDWRRGQVVSFQGRSEKVCQLTGDNDWESGAPTTTRTQTRSGAGAMDLGYPVESAGGLLLLFGDTWPSLQPHSGNEFSPRDDSVGWITTTSAPTRSLCTDLKMNATGTPPVYTPATISTPGDLPQGWFNVPSGGIADGDGVTAFFWTDHCAGPSPLSTHPAYPLQRPAPSAVCPENDTLSSVGRGALAHSHDGGRTFQDTVPLPSGFVYTAAATEPAGDGGSYVFAVPGYRASTPYLAYAARGTLRSPENWRFFSGLDGLGKPLWVNRSAWEASAEPWRPPGHPELFATDRCIGEFSITFNKALGAWLMLYNCTGAIMARTAANPWGPWSDSSVLITPTTDGAPCRLAMMPQGCGNQFAYHSGAAFAGGFYAPFVLDRYTTALPPSLLGNVRSRIYWLLSTWDPYQVTVMRTDLQAPLPRHQLAVGYK